ncbi:MAG: HNH endonuclease [Myxococcales bacterium]|nr:HNH endonuclease [Myxococcales bacterium]
MPEARRAERRAVARVIAYLGEVERRKLYLGQACSSMFAYCTERLGYSENEAQTRIAVARTCLRFPEAMADLESGALHLTGLWLLAPRLTDENVSALLSEVRGKSRRQIEALLARRFPKPDVLPSITPLGGRTMLEQGDTGPGAPVAQGDATPGAPASSRARVEPLSATSFRVEFTASAALRDKLERARDLLSHAEPGGELAVIIERAIDELIAVETKRREGAGKPRKRRETKPGSRHVPVDVQREVRERDADQCTFTDAAGRRCSETRFLTIEHIVPFAKGGPTTVDNCCLLCSAHNSYRARQVFGEEHIQNEIAGARARRETNRTPAPAVAAAPEPEVFEKVRSALVLSGFKRAQARQAVEHVRLRGIEPRVEPLLRAAIAVLTP